VSDAGECICGGELVIFTPPYAVPALMLDSEAEEFLVPVDKMLIAKCLKCQTSYYGDFVRTNAAADGEQKKEKANS
jgi:hypothetical protein